MGKKVISFGLSVTEIDNALKELKRYEKDIVRKTKLLQKRIAEKLEALCTSGFNGAIVDDLVGENGGVRTASVQVSIDERENVSVVIAKGDDAIWVEFGAGVYHNGAVGGSPHPKGMEHGFTIGGYGKGMGKKKAWGFFEDGDLHITHGTPATMPMFNAMRTVCNEIDSIAREVFQ